MEILNRASSTLIIFHNFNFRGLVVLIAKSAKYKRLENNPLYGMLSLVTTAPPGPPLILEVTTITATNVTLSWTRPEVTGRDDFYYSIEYSDPDNTGSFILSNENYVNSSSALSYTVPNLRPNTPYTIRVTTHNGVSDQDTENETLRRVDLPTRTREQGKNN